MGARQSKRSVDITTTPKKEGLPAEAGAASEAVEKIEKLGVIEEVAAADANAKPTSNGVAPHAEKADDKEKDKDEATEKDKDNETANASNVKKSGSSCVHRYIINRKPEEASMKEEAKNEPVTEEVAVSDTTLENNAPELTSPSEPTSPASPTSPSDTPNTKEKKKKEVYAPTICFFIVFIFTHIRFTYKCDIKFQFVLLFNYRKRSGHSDQSASAEKIRAGQKTRHQRTETLLRKNLWQR
uniref:Uncharacterized protein n=1 Tax=Trichogramma kaykai TaxID=54128 RepID=A0ABD2WZ82_9HYME